MNNVISFECPQELLIGLHFDARQFAEYVQFETSVALFKEGKMSSGMAARWLGIPRIQFLLRAFEAGAELADDSDKAVIFRSDL